MDKQALRTELRHKLALLSDDDIAARSIQGCEELIKVTDWSRINRVCCYRRTPRFREVDTQYLLEQLKNLPHIDLTIVSDDAAQPILSVQYDLIIVPLLGFDRDNHRLGRGAGWYDRFLSAQTHARTVGLAFREQELAVIPVEPHDIRLDEVIVC